MNPETLEKSKTVSGKSSSRRDLPGTRSPFRLSSRAWWIASVYFGFATIWILFSDQALSWLFSDSEHLVRWSRYKGLAFVVVTSILLGLLLRRVFGAIESGFNSLRAKEKQLLASEKQLAAIIHSAMDAIVTVDHTQQIVLFNAAAEKMFQCKSSDAIGQPIDRFVPGCFSADDKKPIIQGQRMDGGVFPVEASISRIEDHQHQLLTVILRDLTQRHAREEKRQQAESIARREKLFSNTMIESMPGIIYFYDEKGQFLRWNQNFEVISGYSRNEIPKMSPLDFFPDTDKPRVQSKISEVFEKGESFIEANFKAKDGKLTPYFFTGRRVVFEDNVCLAGMGIDISERKRADMALRVLNQTLEIEVAVRTEELHRTLVRAEAADRIKSAFLATMSHELRTPLNSIIGFTGIILQGMAGPLNREQTKQLGMVRSSARHLLELINDVLDLSKIEAGQLDVRAEPFNLRESIERVIALVKPMAEKKGLVLSFNAPAELGEITSDRRRVEQILLNLVNNAIKFTEHGSVTIHAETMAAYKSSPEVEAQPAIRLRVTDTGIGIKPEDMATLFRPFHQLDSGLARQHEGTGLGLTICRRLATLLGGEILAASDLAKGSEFAVILPWKRSLTS